MTNEKKGIVCFNLEAMFEYFINILVSGAYLAKLTASLGIPDSITGILTSFLSLGSAFQIFTVFIFKKNTVKKKVTIMNIVGDLCFISLYFVPLLDLPYTLGLVIFSVLLLAGYLLIKIPFAPKISFFYSIFGSEKKGILTANKEIISLFSGMAFSYIASKILDKYEEMKQIKTAFLIFGLTLTFIAILHTFSMVIPKETDSEILIKKSKNPLYVLKDRFVFKVIVIDILYTIAVNISTPFFGSYQNKELMFSMTFISILSIVSSIARALISRRFGVIGDKKSFKYLLIICLTISLVAYLVGSFATPNNGKILFSIYTILHAVSLGGINSAKTNLVFDYFDGQKARDVVAIQFSIDGILGFATTALCGIIVEVIQKNNNTIFGLNIYAQQFLSFLSFIVLGVLLLYTIFVLPKRKVR